ncbi:MAG: hypothetical protein Q7U12_13445 [Undibacterium sp.]|nr:hypothetical protein [Undibacterium sp.]
MAQTQQSAPGNAYQHGTNIGASKKRSGNKAVMPDRNQYKNLIVSRAKPIIKFNDPNPMPHPFTTHNGD